MSTKLNNIIINPAFESLFTFKNEEERIEHEAGMISLRILSDVEKLCEERKIKRTDLAGMVGTSKSYITQLFSGDKNINANIMARFENALGITFITRLKPKEEAQGQHTFFVSKKLSAPQRTWHLTPSDKDTESIINSLKTEDTLKQIA